MDNLADVRFEETLNRLREFAQGRGFNNPWKNARFVEAKFIENYYEPGDKILVRKSSLIPPEKFKELLQKGHSWINVNFVGIVDDLIIITIEEPNEENDAKLTSVNLSLPSTQVNNWNASEICSIID